MKLPREAPGAREEPARAAGAASAYRVLVVDDNPAIHEDFGKILAPSGGAEANLADLERELLGESSETPRESFRLDFASQGEQALDMARRALEDGAPFAVVFMDVRMPPGMDGIETARALLSLDREVQIVLCTAYADHGFDEIRERVPDSERLLILKKPFDPIEVRQLAHALSRKWALARVAGARLEDLEAMVEARTEQLRNANERLQREMEERRRAEAQLRHAQRMEAIGRLAGGVAHDFNNLLTLIESHCHLLLEKQPESSELRAIDDAVGQAASLTRQLLAFGRRAQLRPEPLELGAELRKLADMLRRTLGERYRIEFAGDEGSYPVFADRAHLHQVVLNLVINARDAMEQGGTITISLAACDLDAGATQRWQPPVEPGRWIVLSVADTGTGMDEATCARVFDPYFTTKELDRGTGLGLPTALGIVEQSGGTMRVETRRGEGTTFHVFLPRTHLERRDREPVRARPSVVPVGNETLLLVEDEPPVLAIMERVLQRAGYRVLSAPSPEHAMRRWRECGDEVALLISDCIMPGLSGPELASRLREQRRDLPVLFVSGYARQRVGALQDALFLQKPFGPRRLLAMVRRALEHARSA
ncbi:MAG: hybrid sensor histidine kinase/response regulator [Planctomycetota bacterium]|nr:MAG: hybrid sensor histidine kinase/response regulator [Planctomycetota bacterium]